MTTMMENHLNSWFEDPEQLGRIVGAWESNRRCSSRIGPLALAVIFTLTLFAFTSHLILHVQIPFPLLERLANGLALMIGADKSVKGGLSYQSLQLSSPEESLHFSSSFS